MSPHHAKIIVGVTLIIGATAYLGYTSTRSGWIYFVDVDQFIARPEAHAQRARIHGTVTCTPTDIQPARLIARFTLSGTSRTLPVEYHGAIPDMFQTGGEVVVEGLLDDQGVFQADVLLTKRASKYEERATADPAGAAR